MTTEQIANSAADAQSAAASISAQLTDKAVKLAAELLSASRKHETNQERTRSAQMGRMIQDEDGKRFTVAMTDQVLKIEDPVRASERLNSLIEQFGVPKFLSATNRFLLWMGSKAASFAPSFVMPQITKQVRSESTHVIISAEPESFSKYVKWRKETNIRVNFNQLGEAVLGDKEADRRLQSYVDRLVSNEINYASVKLSAVASQLSMTGYQQTIEMLKEKLRLLYRTAINHPVDGKPKFVNLDMEEYRDLHLTVDVFCQVLDEPEFHQLEAGIVLQAYLPDSFEVQKTLVKWAQNRIENGGAGIKIRLVKGANLAMEQVEASLHGWQQAPYYSKLESDANYKRMLEFGTRPENIAAVRMGIASHNLFDIAFALCIRDQRGAQDRIEFEMLEGMANAQALEVSSRTGGLVVYCPAVDDKEFEAAVAYLVRRLDENTAEGSFLGALFSLQEGSPQWKTQETAFRNAVELAFNGELNAKPNRTQNRLTETPTADDGSGEFKNADDTDFSLPCNRQWASQIYSDWKEKTFPTIELEVAGVPVALTPNGQGLDPSQSNKLVYQFCGAGEKEVDLALEAAVNAQKTWSEKSMEERASILLNVGKVFAEKRAKSIGAMVLDSGKAIVEADVEVSEAIDFANYYARSLTDSSFFDGCEMTPKGVVVVTPPWNFPYAIPAGGCLAALMAGNSVILKPSEETVLTAHILAKQLWEAGVPKDVFQFLPIADREVGKKLVTDPRTDVVILTGSYFTAQNFLNWRPDLSLFAETSGKNSLIITANADLDLAIKDLVKGAFGHSGQKCSATSLALIEKSVYDSPKFRQQLLDAAESLIVGQSWDPSAIATPVIRVPNEALHRGLTQLDEGESWLLEPKMIDNNPCHWSPGIKLGVKQGSWYHKTECFGPVLGLIRVESFDEAMEIQNDNDFGLTGGLHSLEPKQIQVWREKVEVGNAYINRSTTGAIVQRQPFGGWKMSSVGSGSKAGGPNYVSCFGTWQQKELPKTKQNLSSEISQMVSQLEQIFSSAEGKDALRAAAGSQQHWWDSYFCKEHDPSQIHGETNHFRYKKRPWHLIRLSDSSSFDGQLSVAIAAVACKLTGCRLEVSVDQPGPLRKLEELGLAKVYSESLESLCKRLESKRDGIVRVLNETDSIKVYQAAVKGNLHVTVQPSLCNGRLELLYYLREQSISETVHRYGNLI